MAHLENNSRRFRHSTAHQQPWSEPFFPAPATSPPILCVHFSMCMTEVVCPTSTGQVNTIPFTHHHPNPARHPLPPRRPSGVHPRGPGTSCDLRDYLTGFHKRKQARRRFGLAMQEIKDRKERLEERKEVRIMIRTPSVILANKL